MLDPRREKARPGEDSAWCARAQRTGSPRATQRVRISSADPTQDERQRDLATPHRKRLVCETPCQRVRRSLERRVQIGAGAVKRRKSPNIGVPIATTTVNVRTGQSRPTAPQFRPDEEGRMIPSSARIADAEVRPSPHAADRTTLVADAKDRPRHAPIAVGRISRRRAVART